jgi:hypothetical protein
MKRFSEQFKKQADKITLKVSEQQALRARLVSYMEYHPLPKELKETAPATLAKAPAGSIVSEPFFAVSIRSRHFRSFAGVFAVFFIVGIPFIAERSLPGDVLYPVKVQFNEELRSSLSFSPYAKVEWETERLGRRIAEARLLASEGKLTQEAEASFAEAVQIHTDAAQREIAEIKANDKDGAAIAEIAFASALAVQSQVLENSTETQEGGNSVLALAEVVARARTTAAASQTEAPSYGKLLAAVEEQSTHVYELFASVKRDASAEEVTDVERRLADIERKMHVAVAYKEGTVIADQALASRAASLGKSKQSPEVATLAVAGDTTDASSSRAMSVTADSASSELATQADAAPEQSSEEVVVSVHTEADAVVVLTGALQDIQKLLSYLTDIEVRKSVSIDELVPLTPTAEENVNEVIRLFDAALAIQNAIYQKDISPRIRNKVSRDQQELETVFAKIKEAIEKGNVDEALSFAQEAQAIAVDLEKMTQTEPMREVAEEVLGTTTDTAVTE